MADDRDVYRPKGRAQTAAPVEAVPAEIGFEPTGVITDPKALAAARARRPTDVSIAHHDERLDSHGKLIDAHAAELGQHRAQLLDLTKVTSGWDGKLDAIFTNSEASAEERKARRAREVERERRRLRTKVTLAVISGIVAITLAAIKVFA